MMGKKHEVRKLAASVLAAGMCVLAVSGCGDVVETQEEVVTIKEQDKEQVSGQMTAAEAAAAGNVASQVQAPEVYQAEVSGGAVRVKIDAAVTIPDVPGIKRKRVVARTFTQEDYDAVNKVLLEGGKLWDRDYEAMEVSHGFFREELEERIEEIVNQIAQNGIDGDTVYNSKGITLNEQREVFESLKEHAPSEEEAVANGWIKEIPAVVSYDEALSEARENELYGYVTVNGQDYSLEIDNNASVVEHRVQFMINKQDGDGNYLSFSNSLLDWKNLPENMKDIQLKPGFVNMDTPPEKVCAEAASVVSQMGIGEYAVQGGGYFACWSADESAMDLETYQASTYLAGIGYGVHLVRIVDGIPVIYTYDDGGQIVEDDVDIEKMEQAVLKGENVASGTTYWPFEEMTIIYNSDGFRTFEWINPYTIEELSEEYVFLLPFSDISDIFEEMILKKNADHFNNVGDTVDIQVDEVVLSYMRVREKGSMEGALIPVWDFFGTKTYKNAAGEVDLVLDRVYDGVLPESMMTINAMDGTIVDRGLGY